MLFTKVRFFLQIFVKPKNLLIFAVTKKRRCLHIMIIVPVKEGENIERALKKFKRKFERTGTLRELRNRKTFEKPSVIKRAQKKKAIYVQKMQLIDE